MGSRIRAGLRVLMEAVPVAVVACLVFLLIRTHLLEYYRIPSKSMAPTLHGDRQDGDLVLVDKTAFWFREPQPFDMVVVRGRPGSLAAPAGHIVKRVVALGPCSVTIQGGDLFVGSIEGGIGKRVVKDPVASAHMRVPVFRHPSPEDGQPFTEFFRMPPGLGGLVDKHVELRAGGQDLAALAAALDPGERRRRLERGNLDPYLPGHMSTRNGIDTSYLDPEGNRQPRDQAPNRAGYLPDIGMTLHCTPGADVTGFQAVIEQEGTTVALACDVGGRGRLMVDGAVTGEFSAPAIRAFEVVELTYGYLDGHCFLIVGGELALHRELELPAPGTGRTDGTGRTSARPNGLHFAVAGKGGRMRIRAVEVFHDVHYLEDRSRTMRRGSNEPYLVQQGCMFLLGDNARDSRDSRDLETEPFRLEDLVGRPVAVLAPPSRSRFLP